MIFPEETTPLKNRHKFITFDIETKGTNFEFLDGAICFDYPEIEFFSSPKSMVERIIEKNNNNEMILYGHNAGRFDCLILINELVEKFNDISILMSGNIVIGWNCFLKTGAKIMFLDSLRLVNMSLKKATHAFDVKNKKIEIDVLPEQLKKSNQERYYEYLKKDVLGLNEVLQKFSFVLENQFGEFKNFVTIASCAFHIFKRTLVKKIYTPKTERLQTFERGSYKGGICFLNHYGTHKDVVVLDVNSLYPYAMSKYSFPTSERGFWTTKYHGVKKIAIYKLLLLSDVPGFPFLYNNKKVVKEKGEEVFACEETVNYIINILRVKIKILLGYVYLDTSPIFEYMKKLYSLRKSDKSLDLPIKLIMNSSYGKFAQKKERHFVALATSERIIRLKQDHILFKDYGEFVTWNETVENKEQFVGIASLILLKSRLEIKKYFDLVPNENNNSPIIYADTDSIHMPEKYLKFFAANLLGDGLGQLKLEFAGDALYVGKKLYVLYGNEKFTEKVKSKGFRGAKASDLEHALSDGKEVETRRFFSLYEGLLGHRNIKNSKKIMRKT